MKEIEQIPFQGSVNSFVAENIKERNPIQIQKEKNLVA